MTKDDFLDYIPPHRKELYFKILVSMDLAEELCLRFYFLDEHFPPNKIDQALKWLVSNDLTGNKFKAWWRYVCKASDLEMHRILLSIVDNEIAGRLIAGKNFKT